MIQLVKVSLVMLVLLSLVTGVIYPLVVTTVGQVAFPHQAGGSLLLSGEVVVGSELIGQEMRESTYFWPRPSASRYNALPSGASNYGPTNAALADVVAGRAEELRSAHGVNSDSLLPSDLLFASASGLDPHISPDAARFQIERVAIARGFETADREALSRLVEQVVEPPQLGILGEARVNVVRLNRALDALVVETR